MILSFVEFFMFFQQVFSFPYYRERKISSSKSEICFVRCRARRPSNRRDHPRQVVRRGALESDEDDRQFPGSSIPDHLHDAPAAVAATGRLQVPASQRNQHQNRSAQQVRDTFKSGTSLSGTF